MKLLLSLIAAFSLLGCNEEPQRDNPFDRFSDATGGQLADARAEDDTAPDGDPAIDVVDTDEIDPPDGEDGADTPDTEDVVDSDEPDIEDVTEEVSETPDTTGDSEDASDATDAYEGASCDAWADVSDEALRASLELRVSADHHYSGSTDETCYRWARDYMYGIRGTGTPIDVFDGYFEAVYTGRLVDFDPDAPTRTPGGMNTEHSWPQSDGADGLPARCDIHHLFPADSSANTTRLNYDFGTTTCNSSCHGDCECLQGGSVLGPGVNGGSVFQVRNERRGDIARAHFYFAVRYDVSIDATEEAVLRQWHQDDPVVRVGESAPSREQIRNDRIEEVQGNRNPFVDCPGLVDRIANF